MTVRLGFIVTVLAAACSVGCMTSRGVLSADPLVRAESVDAAIATKRWAIDTCHANWSKAQPAAQRTGKIELQWRVTTLGTVRDLKAVPGVFGDAKLQTCLESALKSLLLPQSGTGRDYSIQSWHAFPADSGAVLDATVVKLDEAA